MSPWAVPFVFSGGSKASWRCGAGSWECRGSVAQVMGSLTCLLWCGGSTSVPHRASRSALAPLIFSLLARLLVARLNRYLSLFLVFFGYGGRNHCILIFVSTAAFCFCLTTVNPNCAQVLHQHSVSALYPRLPLPSQDAVVTREHRQNFWQVVHGQLLCFCSSSCGNTNFQPKIFFTEKTQKFRTEDFLKFTTPTHCT